MPTDAYGLDEAVRDGFLAPMRSFSVPLRIQREGLRYDRLSEAEREAWDATDWDEDGETPTEVDPAAINQWLFNADTVDKVLAHLMTHGQKVAGGDRLGKTIVFAKNQRHADFIQERFDRAYPHLKSAFAQVITHDKSYAQSLIDQFERPEKAPHIAISVDMLDTGIDVPDVVNLVFFKLVRSRTKFWQMIGRGTRLRPDLFGPGQDKKYFSVFDFCGNLEYFNAPQAPEEGTVADSLGARLFRTRLDLLQALDGREPALRDGIVETLRGEVAAMDPDANFIVRPHRRLVELYATPAAWQAPDGEALRDLAAQIAGLPSAQAAEAEEAKRFDLLALRLQLCVLDAAPGFERLRRQVTEIALTLEGQSGVPAIMARLDLLQALQTDEWWQDVTTGMLETMRKSLRGIVPLIEKSRARVVYTDFEDVAGEAAEIVFEVFEGAGYDRFREKARHFLRAHTDHVAIGKLRMNRPLTPVDLQELERMLCESGIGTPADVERAKADSAGLGLFVRSLVGLDPAAAQAEFASFLAGRTLRPNQIEFVQMVIEHLTEHGFMEASRLYEPPYTDLNDRGLDGVFDDGDADRIVGIITEVRRRAAA